MQHLSKLLKTDNSNLAWVLRLSLHGLRTQLQEALKTATTDPGNSACQELLRELDILLELVSQPDTLNEKTVLSTEDSSSWEDVLEPVSSELKDELKLRQISETLLADRELSNYIGDYQFLSTNDGDLWNEMQRLLLRIPEKIAHVWQEQILTQATQVGATEDKRCLATRSRASTHLSVPFIRNECIYPGFTGKVTATGLCLSDQVDFDQRLMVETHDGELDLLAGVVSIYFKFLELDSSLH
ncbi:MAG: hypothetical protein ACRDEA_17385, partial [Microcystaceae cyanobacterium]